MQCDDRITDMHSDLKGQISRL